MPTTCSTARSRCSTSCTGARRSASTWAARSRPCARCRAASRASSSRAPRPFGECLAGFERLEAAERNWLARPGLTAVLTVNAAGQVASVMIVTVAPSPAHVQRSGIYPGIGSGTVHEIARRDTGTGR
ncbi:MAG: hypothetical protein IPF57_07430 [Gammaproteobacteria bacterium]|nr:hypothetical protein [Gammaproteobacteria bacterium]